MLKSSWPLSQTQWAFVNNLKEQEAAELKGIGHVLVCCDKIRFIHILKYVKCSLKTEPVLHRKRAKPILKELDPRQLNRSLSLKEHPALHPVSRGQLLPCLILPNRIGR